MTHDYERKDSSQGLVLKLYRGEGVALLAFDLDQEDATDDFAGFAVEVKYPESNRWGFLRNRLHFQYPPVLGGKKSYRSEEAPFQKFRWLHVPGEIGTGEFRYRVTARYMRPGGKLVSGKQVESAISLAPETIEGFVNVGFTRGYASSQAYSETFRNAADILPQVGSPAADNLTHDTTLFSDHYAWLGFEARKLIMQTLEEVRDDKELTLDALIYESKEPLILECMQAIGSRLRVIIDDHGEQGASDSAESISADRLIASGAQVRRMHFGRQQHNKVLIVRKNGNCTKVLTGSTNFALRGLYIQSNNVLLFTDATVAELYGRLFDAYWDNPAQYRKTELSQKWWMPRDLPDSRFSFCFSPHADSELSLDPVARAVEEADSSVLYAMVFLNQLTGRVREALDELMNRSLFSYGVAQRTGGLTVTKPDGSRALLPFAYLGANAPAPFQQEWNGNTTERSNMVHHKFMVIDFNGKQPIVFTGSSNFAAGGEKSNGDNMIRIEDRQVATAYAIEALRIFDHFHFRVKTRESKSGVNSICLSQPPTAGKSPWFKSYYRRGHIKERDRKLFSE